MLVIILVPVFKASFPTTFAPEYNGGLTKRESPEEGPYTVTPLNPKTCPVNTNHFTATTDLIYIISRISIHCNLYTEFYCAGDLFLMCNVTTQRISLSSNGTSFAFIETKRMVMDSINDCSIGLYKGRSNL